MYVYINKDNAMYRKSVLAWSTVAQFVQQHPIIRF